MLAVLSQYLLLCRTRCIIYQLPPLLLDVFWSWCGRRLLDGHAGSAIKVLVAIHYSVLDARNGYIRNVVV